MVPPAPWQDKEDVTVDELFNRVVFASQGLLLSVREGSVHGGIQHLSRLPHHCHGYPVSFQVSQDTSELFSRWRKEPAAPQPKTMFKLLSYQMWNKGETTLLIELFLQLGHALVVTFQ